MSTGAGKKSYDKRATDERVVFDKNQTEVEKFRNNRTPPYHPLPGFEPP